MTVRYLVNILLFRLVFPIIVTICVLFRPSVFSFIYLVYLFILPFIPVPTADTMLGSTGRFLKAILGITCSLSLIQAAFQIALVTLNPYAEFLLNDPVLEEILQYIGLVRLNKMSISYILVWIGPEIIMFVATIAFFIVFKRLNPPPGFIVRSEAGTIVVNTVEDTDGSQTEVKQPVSSDYSQYCVAIGRYLTLIMLCLAGVVRPSIESGVYYVIFLAAATWWACYKQLKRGFAILLRCLIPIVILHMCALYFINFKIVQNELPEEGTYSRYFDLLPFATTVDSSSLQEGTNNTSIVNSTSSSLADVNKAGEFSDKRVLLYYFHRELTFYIYPVVLYLLFFFLVVESKELLKPEIVINRRKAEVTEKTPLLRGVSPKRRATKSSLHQDSTGSVTVNENEDIPLDVFEDDDDFEYTVFHNVIFALEAIIQKVVRSSYIATNIIMMAWSITYLSWLTFVLLLWANIIWLIPNQRKRMLSSSPFLVFYALFLLISAYIYSMNLNEDELPMTAQGVDLEEIGFKKPDGDPCLPLLVKSLYTVMFWITLRQYMQEKMEKKQTSALADMVAPLQVTVGTATGVKKDDQPAGGEFMKRMGQFINKFLIKFWIWVVAITLFAVAITGQRMTVFRILYMALFLFFILSFQFSFKVWRKVMFGFWLTVIIYSMIILILVYTYQFKRFPKYWEEYLHIQEENQHDIGLEQYKTKQLFVRLVTPTFFVIVTVLQLHYFHNDFMELTNTKPNSIVEDEIIENDDIDDSSMQGGAFMDQSDASAPSKYYSEISYQDLNIVPSDMIKKWVKRTLTVFLYSKHVAYLFFEIHMIKIVLFFAMLMCIYDKCALYFILVIIISFSFAFGRNLQIFATYFTALFVSVLILGRMIYQISYINDKQWNVKCTINQNPTINETVVNNGPWLGFTKLQDADTNLAEIVKWNIIFIVIMTLWKVVDVRQYNYRLSRGRSTSRRFFMFPKITREDADKNLGNFFKYMANYGFYKFGLEICFIFMVTMIGVRMDMYSLIHSIWLVVMFGLSRKTLSRIWLIYLVFVAISIPVQYLLSVGLPPSLCIEFPWDKPNQTMRNLQEWAFLLDNYNPPAARKLIFDFMLLMATARQWVVFRIEKRYEGKNYAGGSNESVIHHAEQKDFVNPVPDFVTYVRSYLDFLKKAVLQSFLWITLAVVFLAGTSRVNIFSIGYLLFAFLFLWHGSDFYLRPINKILWHWNRLLGFNVSVIMLKCAFQILGCIFPHELPIHSCWLVQIFGIACIRNIGPTDNTVASLKHIIEEDGSCSISKEGLTWDVICFTLLIFQKRLFNSYNFFHIVDDAKATAILASRGAELMEEMRLKTMKEQEEIERRVLEKIREKMERIKANQQKIQDSVSDRPHYRSKQPTTHPQAIRSGDYYMFDEVEDDDIDLLPEEKESLEDLDEGPKAFFADFLHSAIREDVHSALRTRSQMMFASQTHAGLQRQSSVPAGRQTRQRPQLTATISAPPTIAEREPKIVRIQDDTEPEPSTSQQRFDEEDFSSLTEPEKTKLSTKIFTMLLFVWAFLDAAMISLTRFLNKYSKNYRLILKVLAKEKRILKEHTNYNIGLRVGTDQTWQPAGSYHTLVRRSKKTTEDKDKDDEPNYYMEYGDEMSSADQPTVFRLVLAIWYLIMSRSDIVCYFIIFLNQMRNANLISLPLPLMVFFWGTLTIPRPSKTFWVTIIAYTEVVVLLKCLFQFDIMPGNKVREQTEFITSISEQNPFYPPALIGLYKQKNVQAMWDLLLLLVVFFHRVLLKSMGIWSSTSPTTAALIEDGEYRVVDERFEPVEEISEPDENQASSSTDKGKGKAIVKRNTNTSGSGDEIVYIKTKRLRKINNAVIAVRLGLVKYAEQLRLFIQQLLDPTSRVTADVYSLMFLCDFINFFVILFGYSAFGSQQDGGVSSYLEDDRVPPLFLFMLILQFMIILVDRGIYLRKNILAKIIFQFIQIVLLHVWLFILFPIITRSFCNSVIPPQIYYIAKCSYLLLSAFQIRCGYPTRILGNFLCKSYGYVNMFLFRGFMLVPFLFELRTCMDWMWTETSMTIFDWIKMEDIFQNIFLLKCARSVEDEFPQPRAEKKKSSIKYLMGGAILTLIIGIIWFPLVFYSLGNAVGNPNPPLDVTLEIRVGPYEPLYKMTAQSNSIFQFNADEMEDFKSIYNAYQVSENFIFNYEAADVTAIKLSTDSANIWSISPPDRIRMISEINSTKDLKVRLEYKITHKTSKAEDSGIIIKAVEIILPPSTNTTANVDRENLLKMLNGENSNAVLFPYIMPKFIKVTNRGTAEPVDVLMLEKPDTLAKMYRNMTIKLLRVANPGGFEQEWWKVKEQCDDYNYDHFLNKIAYKDCEFSLILYAFSDKVFPPTLSFVTAGGIIGLYTTLVFVASRILRGFFADGFSKIMFEDLPNVDRVLRLCLDIYLVREACDFFLEEDLFAKLVFLYRSPETLIKWTRPKEEVADDDDPEGEEARV